MSFSLSAKTKKALARYLPYAVIGLYASKLGYLYRVTPGTGLAQKLLHLGDGMALAFANVWPSLYPLDLLAGAVCGALVWLVVYCKSKNAKKFRKNEEYGSARWGA